MKRLLILLMLVCAVAVGALLSPLENPAVLAQTNTFCASNLACTVTGAWALNAVTNITASGKIQFAAASGLWADVTAPPYNAKCDGSTDDTTAIQAALNAVTQLGDGTGTFSGGTVFIPSSRNGFVCKVSSLVMDGMINVTVMGQGFIEGNPNANNTGTISFTGTCSTGACLSLKSANGISFVGLTLAFPNATTGPIIDFQHCTVNCHSQTSDAAYINFHSDALQGPGGSPPTVGPLISIPQGEFFRFDGWTTFKGASVFVKGANDNTTFTDLITFDKVFFNIPGTAAVQNAGNAWSFTGIDMNSGQGITTNCIPFLAYTATNVAMQDLTITASEFNIGPTNCTNVWTLVSTPTATGNLGGLTFIGNLVLSPVGATNATGISLGNGQSLISSGNVFQNWTTLYSLGTGASVDIKANIYNGITTFLSGTPSNGMVLDNTGTTTLYHGSNVVFKSLNSTLQVGGLIQNNGGTATLGLTLKKGSGAGNYTNATTTYAVADSTNLCFTVTIPTGWRLGVSASGILGTATAAVVANVALTDNAACSTANAGILAETTVTTTAAAVLNPFALNWTIAGDGASHNVALQFKTSNAADSATLGNSTATLTPQMVFTLVPSN